MHTSGRQTAGCDQYRNRRPKSSMSRVPEEKIRRVYSSLIEKISASEVAAQMYEDETLQLVELNEIQHLYPRNDVKAAEFLLNIVLARPVHVYQSFLRALETNNQLDAYLMLVDDDYVLPPEPLYKIRSNYTFLLQEMDTQYSGLLDRLFNDGVLKLEEKMEIDALTIPSKRCEKLLSILRRKTQKLYEIFVDALEATNQAHVARVLKLGGCYVTFGEPSKQADHPLPPPLPPKPKPTPPLLPVPTPARNRQTKQKSSQLNARMIQQQVTDDAVHGMALLGNRLYLLLTKPRDQLEELDSSDLRVLRRLSVPHDKSPRHLSDMASCQRRRRLYISHNTTNRVHLLQLSTAGDVWSKWKTDGSPWGLSVTPDSGNLLVTLRYDGRVDEYSPRGERLRSVDLSIAFSPWHTIQLSNLPSQPEMLLVNHGDQRDKEEEVRVGVLRVLDGGGTAAVRWYGGRGASAHLLSKPQHLAVSRDGTVAVADTYNDRVILLDDQLQQVGVVEAPADDRAAGWRNSRVCWINRRLCVSESLVVEGRGPIAARFTVYELQ